MMETSKKQFEAIAAELKAMYEEDQMMRRQYLSDRKNQKWDDSIDLRNTKRLQEIIEDIGWPSISKVGDEGAMHAWLLAQHADHNPQFQKRCLALMKDESKDDVDTQDIAFLEDRIAVGEGRPQLYGTQFYEDSDGQTKPRPILDPKNIEKRRKEMGLDSFEEYKKGMVEKVKP